MADFNQILTPGDVEEAKEVIRESIKRWNER